MNKRGEMGGAAARWAGKLLAMTGVIVHRTSAELEAGLAEIRRSPRDQGRLELIVRRPAVDVREVLEEAVLDESEGLVGDTWSQRSSSRTDDGSPHPRMQLNIMNARAAALVAVDPERRRLAGDQLYLDLDLSEENLPAGTRLSIGTAVIEITEQPHRGCAKFSARFGADALRFVNSPDGRSVNARGVNAAVVTGGVIRAGDVATKLA
jgi:MOSC domain-containing protein